MAKILAFIADIRLKAIENVLKTYVVAYGGHLIRISVSEINLKKKMCSPLKNVEPFP